MVVGLKNDNLLWAVRVENQTTPLVIRNKLGISSFQFCSLNNPIMHISGRIKEAQKRSLCHVIWTMGFLAVVDLKNYSWDDGLEQRLANAELRLVYRMSFNLKFKLNSINKRIELLRVVQFIWNPNRSVKMELAAATQNWRGIKEKNSFNKFKNNKYTRTRSLNLGFPSN